MAELATHHTFSCFLSLREGFLALSAPIMTTMKTYRVTQEYKVLKDVIITAKSEEDAKNLEGTIIDEYETDSTWNDTLDCVLEEEDE